MKRSLVEINREFFGSRGLRVKDYDDANTFRRDSVSSQRIVLGYSLVIIVLLIMFLFSYYHTLSSCTDFFVRRGASYDSVVRVCKGFFQ